MLESCWSISARPTRPIHPLCGSFWPEFLSDPRVVEIPPALWKPVLYGVILRTRPAKTAEAYRKIWTNEGSP
jgi:ferrochelatase